MIQTIDLMHDDVTRPKGSMVVVVTLKSKMDASSANSGGNSKITYYLTYLKGQINPPSCYLTAQPHQNTFQHFCYLNFLLWGNTTPYWIRAWLQLPQCTMTHRVWTQIFPLSVEKLRFHSMYKLAQKLLTSFRSKLTSSKLTLLFPFFWTFKLFLIKWTCSCLIFT